MEDLDETIVTAVGSGTTSGTNVFSVTAEVHDEMRSDSWSDENWNSTEAHQSLNFGQGTHDPRSCSTGGGEAEDHDVEPATTVDGGALNVNKFSLFSSAAAFCTGMITRASTICSTVISRGIPSVLHRNAGDLGAEKGQVAPGGYSKHLPLFAFIQAWE